MFTIASTPIDAAGLKAALANAAAGACVEFQGWVRDHNDGRPVRGLAYEVYAELAESEGRAILDEVRHRYDVLDARCVHRVGELAIGDMAVWVGVTARHRDAAFRACRAIIDEVKARVPIWKQEYYTDGSAEWVNCAACAAHDHAHGHAHGQVGDAAPAVRDEAAFYRRQVVLPQVGAAGQARLKAARVLVVGAGGLGCPALRYLAAAGVGSLTVCDDDAVDITNLHRQVLYDAADVGRNKAEIAAAKLRAQNPHVRVAAVPARCTAANVRELVRAHDVVLDGADNLETKFLLHDACFWEKRPLVQASLYQFEGQLQVFRPGVDAGCLRCLWPETPAEGCVGTCAETGVLGAVAGLLGVLQAGETLKLLLGMPDLCDRHLLLVDAAALTIQRFARPRQPQCPLCGAQPARHDVPAAAAPDWIVDARTLTAERLARWCVVDIRGADERVDSPDWIRRLPHVPWTDETAFARLAPDRQYLLCCAHGVRSRRLSDRLRAAGFANFFTLRQGIDALAPFLGR